MSEKEIRGLLKRACEDLDRIAKRARKAALPATLGAGLALGACVITPKPEAVPDPPPPPDNVEAPVPADASFAQPPPPPDRPAVADAGVPEAKPPVADARVPVIRRRHPNWDPPRPYMAPDATPLYQHVDEEGIS